MALHLVDDTARPGEPEHRADDDATRLLALASELHAAKGDVAAWTRAVTACRDWFGCVDALDVGAHPPSDPQAVVALADRIAQCAREGLGRCGGGRDALLRGRCNALAPHLADSAATLRRSLWASDYESLRPIWILSRDGRVLDANAAAHAVTEAGDRLHVVDGRLAPRGTLATARLARALAEAEDEMLLAWPDGSGGETELRLHPTGDTVRVTLVQNGAEPGEVAERLVRLLGVTVRQADLAAHLAAGLSVAASARAMGISRDTANDHLRALRRHTGTADRTALVALLRRSLQG